MKLARFLTATALVGACGFIATSASAQTSAPTDCVAGDPRPECPQEAAQTDTTLTTPDEPQASGPDVVVTGSRVRTSTDSGMEPITVINSKEITQLGFNSAAEALQSTAVTGGTSQINNYYGGYVTDGGTGANTLGLRGLGPDRTLLLLNGHRIAPAGSRGSVGSADLNVLPTAMIDRIEILKAGASSIYGSDAIAGVVNIITKNDLRGLYIDAQNNIPEIGAGGSRRIAASFGYKGDRLSISGSLEYYVRDDLQLRDANFTRCPTDYLQDGAGGGPGSGDFIDPNTGKPKCFTLNNGGVTINTIGTSDISGQPFRAPGTLDPKDPGQPEILTSSLVDLANGIPANYTGACNRFRPNAAVTGTEVPGYECVGGGTINTNLRDTFDPESQKQSLVSPVKIYTAFLQASYKVAALDDAEVYFEGLVNRRKSSATLYRQISLDYPVDLILNADGDPIAYGDPNPLVPVALQGSILSVPTVTTNGKYIGVRAFVGAGNLDSNQNVDFVKLGGGLRGDLPFAPDFRYDFYLSKTWTDATYTTGTFLNSKLANATDAVQNPDGSFSCRSSAPGCVPLPYLSADVVGGNLPQAFRDYITADVTGTTKFRESVASLSIDGPIFRLPGGQAQIALGAEYRADRINDTPPIESQTGDLFGLTSATPTRGTDSVWEAFAEVNLPILSNVPFFYRLSLDGSARYTDYRSYGSNETYKISGEWEPIHGFALRGSYGTSYRAPALFEQFLGGTSGFLGADLDPCEDYQAPGTNPITATNCASEGLPGNFHQTSSTTVITNGGADAGLEAETSKNLSFGAVLHPQFGQKFGDLSIAVDYYNIEVDNGVSRVGAQSIISLCYNDPEFRAGGSYCNLVDRNADNSLTVFDSYINLSTTKVKGIDYNVRYSHDVGASGRLTLDGALTEYISQGSKLFPTDPFDEQNGLITEPGWTGTADVIYSWKNFTFRYGLDWIDGDKTHTYKYFGLDPATSPYYLEVPDYFRHTASVEIALNRFSLTMGVRNFTNSKLPRISSGVFSLSGNSPLYSGYDYVGRSYFVNVSANF